MTRVTAMTVCQHIVRKIEKCRHRERRIYLIEERKEERKLTFHRCFTGIELQGNEPAPIEWIVNGLIPTGLTLLCGASKIGKSWMSLQLAVAVSSGKDFLGFQVHKSNVLYLALEDTERRIYERTMLVLNGSPMPEGLSFMTRAFTLSDGLIEELSEMVKSTGAKLTIIDTLQMIRGGLSSKESLYGYDYREMVQLKNFADDLGVAVLVVHHTRKSGDNDRFNTISGTTGIMGASDGSLILYKKERSDDKAYLDVIGRDVEEQEYVILWDKDKHSWAMEETKAQEIERETVKEFDESLAMKAILSLDLPVRITATEISKKIEETTGKSVDAYRIGTDIQRFSAMLEKRYRITHRTERTSSKRIHIFEKGEKQIETKQ